MVKKPSLLSGPAMNDALSETPMLLKPEEAAKTLNLCERQLRYLKARGEIPYVQIGASVRYDAADLRAWIDSHKIPAIAC